MRRALPQPAGTAQVNARRSAVRTVARRCSRARTLDRVFGGCPLVRPCLGASTRAPKGPGPSHRRRPRATVCDGGEAHRGSLRPRISTRSDRWCRAGFAAVHDISMRAPSVSYTVSSPLPLAIDLGTISPPSMIRRRSRELQRDTNSFSALSACFECPQLQPADGCSHGALAQPPQPHATSSRSTQARDPLPSQQRISTNPHLDLAADANARRHTTQATCTSDNPRLDRPLC